MRIQSVILAASMVVVAPAAAEEMQTSASKVVEKIVPEVGVEASATVGSNVYERSKVLVYIKMAVPVAGQFPPQVRRNFLREELQDQLHIIARTDPNAAITACTQAIFYGSFNSCMFDDNKDGVFDSFMRDGRAEGRAKPLKAGVPYRIIEGHPIVTKGSISQTVTFLGSTADTLRLSYREFMASDADSQMARPAFTEELTFPLSKKYPQEVAFKDVKMTVLGIDGTGMRFKLHR